MSDKAARLARLTREIEQLAESPLYAFRVENDYRPVIGEGSVDADIVFIGEAPGKREAETGRPFVGAAGRLLNDLLAGIGLDREDVYITNIVKDRPPNNRDPHKAELALYAPFLREQLEILQPKVIATLGRFSMDFILELFDLPQVGRKIGELHGQVLEVQAEHGPVAFVPLYHPAAALYNNDQRATLEADFQVLRSFISGRKMKAQSKAVPAGEQVRPENEEIAALLEQLADLLRALDADSYRVRAYYNGANAVRQTERPVAQIVREGGQQALEALPGIGAKLAVLIAEYVETGRSSILDQLQGQAAEQPSSE